MSAGSLSKQVKKQTLLHDARKIAVTISLNLMTLNMTRQGYFGDLVHGEAAYIHTLMGMNFAKPKDDQQVDNGYTDMWRLRENMRNGNLYPTHGLGPICQTMNYQQR